ncbi:helix-turn-helix transcriptional regulator [Amycolatopsis thermoflava]|uniref:helix-turn-helix transcriptional regulator n=1 Tax=Amycolatopsis thermoflava TaxID=84480 RepID=UPI003669F1A0
MGYPQEAFATAVGVEFTTVGRWERGELTPQPWRRGRIAKALGVTLEELGALLSPDTRRNSQRPAPSEQRVVHVPPGDPSAEDDMNRRSLLRLFSMAGAFLSLPDPADGHGRGLLPAQPVPVAGLRARSEQGHGAAAGSCAARDPVRSLDAGTDPSHPAAPLRTRG